MDACATPYQDNVLERYMIFIKKVRASERLVMRDRGELKSSRMRRGSHASADEEGGVDPCPAASASMLLGFA